MFICCFRKDNDGKVKDMTQLQLISFFIQYQIKRIHSIFVKSSFFFKLNHVSDTKYGKVLEKFDF